MHYGLINTKNFYKLFIILISILNLNTVIHADEYHYKNVLVGDRAATLGGTYVAISDDASGTYYNPAGISFAVGESVSGSGNAYHTTKTTYKNAIGDSDWNRESSTILPNFFGMTKRFDSITFAFSYIVPDSTIEHQDEKFDVENSNAKEYYLSLHAEDKTNMLGPSISYQINDTLSIGMGVFYAERLYRYQQHQFITYQDSSTDSQYQRLRVDESYYVTKFGIQYSPFEPFFLGLTYTESTSISRKTSFERSKKLSSESDDSYTSYTEQSESDTRKYASQLSLGMVYYPTSSLLLAADIDHYMSAYKNLEDVTNYSFGVEWFMNANHAFRFGYFTNFDNRESCTTSSCNGAKIDMTGFTAGYSSYTTTSSFTLGLVYSSGSGKADIYGDRSNIVDMNRESTTIIFAANYDY